MPTSLISIQIFYLNVLHKDLKFRMQIINGRLKGRGRRGKLHQTFLETL